jgi:hypothetical protein
MPRSCGVISKANSKERLSRLFGDDDVDMQLKDVPMIARSWPLEWDNR